MATKLYNSHLNDILSNCKEYYILDTYISLVHISSEVNEKYLIQTYSDSKADLIALVRKHVNASYKTIYNCIETLLQKNILKYNDELSAWTLVNMENMTRAKSASQNSSEFSGYTNIRSFFFTEEFNKMRAPEKRLLVFMAQLSDSKAADFHKGYVMNLLKPNSSWMKVLKTKCKYYAKYTIEKMLSKHSHIFDDNTKGMRESDIAPKRVNSFKFSFNCSLIKEKNTDETAYDLVVSNNPKEYALIREKLNFAEVTLSKHQIMHFIRAIQNLKEWFLKERVVQLIVNKYRAILVHKSRENIKSLPAYAAAVVRSVVLEFNSFKESEAFKNSKGVEAIESFIDISPKEIDLDVDLSKRIEYALAAMN
ncbi:MAG: hypothetical protein ACRC2K_01545 [Clostridium sp.]